MNSPLHDQGTGTESSSQERPYKRYVCMYSTRDHVQMDWHLKDFWLKEFLQHARIKNMPLVPNFLQVGPISLRSPIPSDGAKSLTQIIVGHFRHKL